jgi:hypothetical protein
MDYITSASEDLVCSNDGFIYRMHTYNLHQAFITKTIDVYKIKYFPKGKVQDFISILSKELILEYRNIHQVCESIFSNPVLWNVMYLNPAKVYRSDDRIYILMCIAEIGGLICRINWYLVMWFWGLCWPLMRP